VDGTDWAEIIVMPTNNGDHFFTGVYLLKDLEAATHYQAR